MRNVSLFDSLEDEHRSSSWRPDEPPQIASRGIKHIRLNFETTGLEWFRTDRPISATVMLPDGSVRFLPWGFRGGNLDPDVCRRWAQREIRDLHIENINTRFEVHMSREWGVDLEEQNCTVSDIAHYAALLDDHRQRFSLDSLLEEFCGGVRVPRLDESRYASYHAEEAAPRARYQVEAVKQLSDIFLPKIREQELERVLEVENALIYPVCECEKNGAYVDVELLDKWIAESKAEFDHCLYQLIKMTGFQTDPGRAEHRQRLFEHYKIPLEYLPSGRASFTDAIMKQVEHPAIVLLRRAIKIGSLRSKYLLKYKRNVDSNGLIRFALHQLRGVKDPLSDYAGAGTVTGRFSSSEIVPDYGINVQQEMKAAKQRVAFGFDEDDDSHDDDIFLIRKLRIPPPGSLFFDADALQEEYRIFASYAGNPRVLAAYREDPYLNFHRFMYNEVQPKTTGVWTYRNQKDLNFAYIYGAGLIKQALMLGHISKALFDELKRLEASNNPAKRREAWDHPALAPTKEVRRIYKQVLPEVGPLLAEASHIAMPECNKSCNPDDDLHKRLQHRGYVRTILGRRSRFPQGHRIHKAFNSVDQGTGGDVIKVKMIELHRERKHTGLTMRYPVHDEIAGDVPDNESAERVLEVLNQQSFPQLKVPILWEASTGHNWAECKEIESKFGTSDYIKTLIHSPRGGAEGQTT